MAFKASLIESKTLSRTIVGDGFLYLAFILQVLCIFVYVMMAYMLGFDTAHIVFGFNQGMEFCGILVCFAIYFSCMVDCTMTKSIDSASFTFMIAVAMVFFILFFDATSYFVEGRADMMDYLRISNYMICLLNIAVLSVVWRFVSEIADMPLARKRPAMRAVIVISSIGFLLVFLNLVWPYRFFVNAIYCYERGRLFWIGLVVPLILLAMIAVAGLRSQAGVKIKVSTVLYCALPVLAMVGSMYVEEISLTCLAAVVSIVILFGNVYLQRGNVIKEQEVELAKRDAALADQKIAILLSQVQPHFLYNSLTAIMAIPGNPPETRDAIAQFGKYLRGNLDSLTVEGLIPFHTEMEHVKNYVSLEKLRFKERLNVEYNIECEDFKIPAMTIQMLVENAVKHGVTAKEQGGTVAVVVHDQGSRYCMEVIDDGVGFDERAPRPAKDKRSHVGVENVRDRIERLQGGSLVLKSIPGQGTVATVYIPKAAMGGGGSFED